MLKVNDIHTFYGYSYILQGISFHVNKGEIVTLLGRNGMGKTTTIKSIMGLVTPKTGKISFKGKEIVGWKPYEVARIGIGLVPEDRRIFSSLTVLENLNLDAAFILENDPASNSIEEVYLAYPGFYAIAIYRLSHELYLLDMLLFSRLMSEYAHQITGTDIHAGATIASPFFIDHATGIVIGETTVIEKHVKLYQGVTLGALSVSKDMKSTKRHPTVEKNVCIYANATILGGETTIGKNCIIGGNTWITKSIPAKSIVTNTTITEVKIKELK